MATFKNIKGDNPNYWVHISCPGHDVEVITELPEQLQSGVQSDWESALPSTLAQAFGLGEAANKMLGTNPQLKNLSYQVWLGTSPIEIPIQLHFDHYESAFNDVYKPIVMIKSLAFPVNTELSDNIMLPPGPKPGGNGNDYSVHVKIGRMMMFQDCILTSANETFDMRLGPDGYPIAGDIELTLRTSVVYGHKDYLRAMQLIDNPDSNSAFVNGSSGGANLPGVSFLSKMFPAFRQENGGGGGW